MKIIVTLPDETTREVQGTAGEHLMQAMIGADVPVIAACGGALACATCHVQVAETWFDRVGPAGPEESDLLDMSAYRAPTSRLSCQIPLTDALDGLEVTVQLDALDS